MPNPILEINNLQIQAKIYQPGEKTKVINIVDDVSLKLGKGKVMGLIGESGAGKSTIGLASMFYGRGGVKITGGEIILNGRDITKLSKTDLRNIRGKEVCYVSQSAAAGFNPSHRLMEQIIEATLLHTSSTKSEAEQRAIYFFDKLGLPEPENFGSRYPHQVSGGQLQRAMTVMALCPKPDLIIFDEPTTALDVTTQIDVLKAIKDAIVETGVSALYITHDLAVVAQVADEIMVLRYGKTVEHNTTVQILDHPKQDYTRELLSVRAAAHEEKKPGDNPIVTIKNIDASYKRSATKVLKDISMEVYGGQTLAVVGESGSGKSTVARVVTGLLPPSNGHVMLMDKTLNPHFTERSKEDLRKIQMIFQMPDVAMNPRQTVESIIGRPLEFYFGIKGKEQKKKVIELLDEIELGKEFIDRYPAELSGGQKQRVCIARALAANPDVIICDEVTSALDPLIAEEIIRLLLTLQKNVNMAYLFITHDLAMVKAIADSIAVMYQGEIVRYGPKTDVLKPPFDDYTDLLLSSIPNMDPNWLDQVIKHRKMSSAGN